MNLIDIVILIILLVSAIAGFRRGLAQSLAGIIGSVGGLIAGYQFARPVAARAELLWGVTTRLAAFCAKYVKVVLPATASLPENATPTMVQQALSAQSIPAPIRDYFLRNMNDTLAQLGSGSLTDLLARTLAGLLITAVAFTVIYLLCRAVALLIGAWLTHLAERSPLNMPNHFGGGLIGLLEGAIGVTLAVGLLTMVVALLPPTGTMAVTCAQSGLVKLFAKAFYALVPAAIFPGAGAR